MITVYKVSTSYTYCLYLKLENALDELKMLISDLDNKVTIEKIEMNQKEYNNFKFTGW
jgi:hypothetical protein